MPIKLKYGNPGVMIGAGYAAGQNKAKKDQAEQSLKLLQEQQQLGLDRDRLDRQSEYQDRQQDIDWARMDMQQQEYQDRFDLSRQEMQQRADMQQNALDAQERWRGEDRGLRDLAPFEKHAWDTYKGIGSLDQYDPEGQRRAGALVKDWENIGKGTKNFPLQQRAEAYQEWISRVRQAGLEAHRKPQPTPEERIAGSIFVDTDGRFGAAGARYRSVWRGGKENWEPIKDNSYQDAQKREAMQMKRDALRQKQISEARKQAVVELPEGATPEEIAERTRTIVNEWQSVSSHSGTETKESPVSMPPNRPTAWIGPSGELVPAGSPSDRLSPQGGPVPSPSPNPLLAPAQNKSEAPMIGQKTAYPDNKSVDGDIDYAADESERYQKPPIGTTARVANVGGSFYVVPESLTDESEIQKYKPFVQPAAAISEAAAHNVAIGQSVAGASGLPVQPELPPGGVVVPKLVAAQTRGIVAPKSQAEYDQLASGTQYIHPDGTIKRKK